jgi:hypothetical protein
MHRIGIGQGVCTKLLFIAEIPNGVINTQSFAGLSITSVAYPIS